MSGRRMLLAALVLAGGIDFFSVSPRTVLWASDDPVIDRMNQLESETQALRAELDRLRQPAPVQQPMVQQDAPVARVSEAQAATSAPIANNTLAALPEPAVAPAAPAQQPAPAEQNAAAPAPTVQPIPPEATLAAPASTASLSVPPASQDEYYSMDEIRAEMKKLVWKKGDFTVTPYGTIWTSMSFESQRTNNGYYTIYAYSPQDQSQATNHFDMKSTRLGLDLLGPRIPYFDCAQSGGKVEIDFQGTPLAENKAGLLLRHAYWEVKNEEFRLLAGQTWDVMSPLNPSVLQYAPLLGAGNMGYRRAQLRLDRFYAYSDVFMITAQSSLNATVVTDTATGVTTDHSDYPTLEGRLAATIGERGKGCFPAIFGVSSHFGDVRYSFTSVPAAKDQHFKTWSINADMVLPITSTFGFQGEWFTGENLSAFTGGILQGVNMVTREGIYSTGGWIETYYDWTPRTHFHVGYGLDDPLDSDISTGGRTYNQAIYANATYDLTKQFQVGFEYSNWQTVYKGMLPGNSDRFEIVAKYGF